MAEPYYGLFNERAPADTTRRPAQGRWGTAPPPAGATGATTRSSPMSTVMNAVGGVRKAGAMTPPTQSKPQEPPWTPKSAPGVGEDWWSRYGDKWNEPGAASDYWKGVQGFFTNPTTSGETNVQNLADQLKDPGAMENLYDEFRSTGQFQLPGMGENAAYDAMTKLQPTGQGEDYYNANKGFFNYGTDLQGRNQGFQDRLGGNAVGDRAAAIQGDIDNATRMQGFFDETRGDLTRAGYTERMAQGYEDTPSYNELFLTGGGAGGGLDALYSRLQQQGGRALDERAAAAGGFNSGAALRANEELNRDLIGQHVQAVQAASSAADASKMARLGEGRALMQGADTALTSRIGTGYQGAEGSDRISLGRADAALKLAQALGGETRANVGLGAQISGQTDAGLLSKVMGGGQLANSAQELAFNRIMGGADVALRGQDAGNTRIRTGLEGAQGAQAGQLSRLLGAGSLENTGQGMILQRLLGGGQLAAGAGNEDITRLTGGQAGATTSQRLGMDRETGVFDKVMRQAQAQAATYGAGMDKARQEQFQTGLAQIEAMVKSGQITAEQGQQQTNQLLQWLMTPLAVAK